MCNATAIQLDIGVVTYQDENEWTLWILVFTIYMIEYALQIHTGLWTNISNLNSKLLLLL